MDTLEQLKFPIGRFTFPSKPSQEQVNDWIKELEALPALLRNTLKGMTKAQLNTPYRPDGWTIQQVVHHLADSHMNAFIRFKWALTENQPMIKAYNEALWAELPDTFETPVEVSLQLIDALHQRWVLLMKHMTQDDFKKTFLHPENDWRFQLDKTLAMYVWHGKHHVGHINIVKQH